MSYYSLSILDTLGSRLLFVREICRASFVLIFSICLLRAKPKLPGHQIYLIMQLRIHLVDQFWFLCQKCCNQGLHYYYVLPDSGFLDNSRQLLNICVLFIESSFFSSACLSSPILCTTSMIEQVFSPFTNCNVWVKLSIHKDPAFSEYAANWKFLAHYIKKTAIGDPILMDTGEGLALSHCTICSCPTSLSQMFAANSHLRQKQQFWGEHNFWRENNRREKKSVSFCSPCPKQDWTPCSCYCYCCY